MKRNIFPDGLKPRRGRLLFWLPALVLAAVCLVGAGWALRSHGSASEPQDSRAEVSPAKRSTPVTVALGQADVEGGRPVAFADDAGPRR
jgi:hypothetical protein